MSHEIRTPMTAITGFAELLGDDTISKADRAAFIQTIRRNSEHLLGVINDVLDLSKIEAGKLDVSRQVCSPAKIVREVEALQRLKATECGITLTVDVQPDAPLNILSDALRVKQILLNLISNAIKFTELGHVNVYVSADHGAARPRVKFEIVDTGIGMTQQQLSKLFQPFQQADTSTTRRFGGTGLGLAICKQLACALAGDLTVNSELGVGTRFTLSLDVGHVSTTEMPALPALPTPSLTSVAATHVQLAGRVLVADDSPDSRLLIKRYLSVSGLDVTTVKNGAEAIAAVKAAALTSTPFNVVLMDMQMPEVDGYTATARLRADGFVDLPIIAFTAHALESERHRCRSAGCDDFITKPIDRLLLLSKVAHHIAGAPVAR